MTASQYVGDTIDSVLGQEFLTWLWFRSDTAPGSFADANGNAFAVTMNQRVVVQGGDGDLRETTSVSGGITDGVHLPLREARLGLMTGKKVTRALLGFEQDSMQWQFTARADDLSFASLHTPTPAPAEEDDDPDALFLEKMYLVERGTAFLDILYKTFLSVRLSATAWEKEVAAIATWMARQE